MTGTDKVMSMLENIHSSNVGYLTGTKPETSSFSVGVG